MDTSTKERGATKPRVRSATAVLPPMTDELGKHWKQPAREKLFISADIVYMSQASFDKLPEYSSSIPSGVYPGKMWKTEIYDHAGRHPVPTGIWYLRWFGIVEGKPTPQLIEAHRVAFQNMLGDMVEPPVTVEFVEIT